jgi:hypothetical protein
VQVLKIKIPVGNGLKKGGMEEIEKKGSSRLEYMHSVVSDDLGTSELGEDERGTRVRSKTGVDIRSGEKE